MFYFEAQTGILRDKLPSFSNFHNYKLPDSARDRVSAAVEVAAVDSHGLTYPGDFVIWLRETEVDQNGS